MINKTYASSSVEQTEQIACEFASTLSGGEVIAYTGGLGAGKTAFTRGLAKGLDVIGEVCSPTFALVHEYQKGCKGICLYHFDMYRISGFDDLYSTGFFDYMSDDSVLAIEWSENITEHLPEHTIFVDITITDENSREIKIHQN